MLPTSCAVVRENNIRPDIVRRLGARSITVSVSQNVPDMFLRFHQHPRKFLLDASTILWSYHYTMCVRGARVYTVDNGSGLQLRYSVGSRLGPRFDSLSSSSRHVRNSLKLSTHHHYNINFRWTGNLTLLACLMLFISYGGIGLFASVLRHKVARYLRMLL